MSRNKRTDKKGNKHHEESKGDLSSQRTDQWTLMKTTLSRMYDAIEKDQKEVTYGCFLSAVYAIYNSKK